MESRGRKVGTFVLVVLVVSGGFAGVGAAAWGFQDCDYRDSLVMAFASGITSPNEDGTCRFNPEDTETQLEDQMSTNETYDEVVRVTDVRANEERLIDTLLNSPQYSKEPVRQEAELKFADAYMNNSTELDEEGEVITAARDVVKSEYNSRIKSLLARYSRDVRNSRDTYNELERDDATSLFNVYVDGKSLDTSNGVNFSVPTSLNDTANGTTHTLPSGENVSIATVTVNGTVYTHKDNLSITVDDPDPNSTAETPVLGEDLRQAKGAGEYDPSSDGYNASMADIVVAADGSGDYSSFKSGLNNAVDGDVVYVKNGVYEFTGSGTYGEGITLEANVTVIGEKDATVRKTDSGATWPVIAIDYDGGSSDGVPQQVTFKGLQIFHASDTPAIETKNEGEATVRYVTATTDDSSGEPAVNAESSASSVDVAHSLSRNYSDVVGNSGGASTESESYPYYFRGFTNPAISEQKSDRDEILNAFGNSSSGYLHDVYNQLESDQLAITDILTYEQMFSQSFSEEDAGSRAWLDAQYMQAGMSGSTKSTAAVEVQTGSTVFVGAEKSGETSVSSDTVYRGHIWTMNPPSNATWETNKTYSTSDLGGPVYVTYYQQKETVNDDGSITVETVPATIAVKGEFRLNEIINKSGASVSSIDHGGTTSADPYNASTYTEDIETLNGRIGDLQKQLEANDGGGGGASSCTGGYPIIGCVNLYAHVVALALGAIAVYSFFGKGVGAITEGIFQ